MAVINTAGTFFFRVSLWILFFDLACQDLILQHARWSLNHKPVKLLHFGGCSAIFYEVVEGEASYIRKLLAQNLQKTSREKFEYLIHTMIF